jgi:hypothetical protein
MPLGSLTKKLRLLNHLSQLSADRFAAIVELSEQVAI